MNCQVAVLLCLSVYLLFITKTVASSDVKRSGSPAKQNNLFDEEYLNIGGWRLPLLHRMTIPKHKFLQNGFLGSLLANGQKDHPLLIGEQYDVSKKCMADMSQLLLSLNDSRTQYKEYVLKMIDAEAKIPSGILDGKIYWFGSYDECVAAESPITFNHSGDIHKISGRHCMASLDVFVQKRALTFGVCVPDSCSGADVTTMINNEIHKALPSLTVLSTVCGTSNSMTSGVIAALVVCGVIAGLCVAGTITDLVQAYVEKKRKEKAESINGDEKFGEPNERTGLLSSSSPDSYRPQLINPPRRAVNKLQFLIAFSFVTNTRKLLSTSTSSGPLASLNGIRVLSMWWVILGHTFLFAALAVTMDNGLEAVNVMKDFWFQPVLNGTFSVDSFFLLSGLLVTYLCLKNLQQNEGRINWALFYFHRYWRLTPLYGFVIMVWGALYMYIVFPGPALTLFLGYPTLTQGPIKECAKTWWTNILYINNFHPYLGDFDRQCLGWSWYLANDMQFFLFSPIIIILLYKHRFRIIGIAVSGFLIASCIFIRAMTAYEYGIQIPLNKPTKHTGDPYANGQPLYNKPYTRMAPYIVGMLIGYALYMKNCRHRISKVKLLIGWVAAIAIGVSTVYGLYDYYHNGKIMSLGLSAFYTGFERLAWSISLGWVIYACVTGYGGLVNSILSWKVWGPLGRLTYCAYLVHPIIMEIYANSLTGYFHYSTITIVYLYFGNLVATYLVAYVVSMAVEAPMLGLEKIIFKR